MELGIPCYSCTSVYGKPALNRKTTTPKSHTYHFNPSKFRRKTTSELQTNPVEVTGRAGNSYPASIPTHKVTVHDRQRGVVHEFVVPEVQSFLSHLLFVSWEKKKKKIALCISIAFIVEL